MKSPNMSWLSRQNMLRVGLGIGLLVGVLTLTVQELSSISANPLIGFLQEAAMILIMPGLLASAIIAGNVHDSPLGVASISNLAFYSLMGWLCSLLVRNANKRAAI